MDVNGGKVTNFTADMQVELYDGSNPHSHQFINFRQADKGVFELDVDNSGEIRGTMTIWQKFLDGHSFHIQVFANSW